jgi:hypothetical protein
MVGEDGENRLPGGKVSQNLNNKFSWPDREPCYHFMLTRSCQPLDDLTSLELMLRIRIIFPDLDPELPLWKCGFRISLKIHVTSVVVKYYTNTSDVHQSVRYNEAFGLHTLASGAVGKGGIPICIKIVWIGILSEGQDGNFFLFGGGIDQCFLGKN